MPHSTELTVQWGDTDAGGLIYYPRFFHYVVIGLNDYFSPATDGVHPMEYYRRRGCLLPAVDASASFHTPLRAGDRVVVTTTVHSAGNSSLTVGFSITLDGEEAATGEVTFVFVDSDFQPQSLPTEMRECVVARGDG